MNTPTSALADISTRALIDAAITLNAIDERNPQQRLARAWVTEEIERRFPEVAAAMDRWSEDLDTPLSYVEALVAALPPEAVQ